MERRMAIPGAETRQKPWPTLDQGLGKAGCTSLPEQFGKENAHSDE
jgi:hypothetical protein